MDAIRASLENHVFPKLGARPIDEVVPRDIRDVVQAVERLGAAETAGRVFQRLRSVFRYAIAHDLAKTDPTYPLKPAEIFRPRRVKHRASLGERDMPAFLCKLEAYEGSLSTRLALKLLILTATRPGEVRAAQWNEFDLDRALWRIPAKRMKMQTEHLVPLSEQALQVLHQLHGFSRKQPLLFVDEIHAPVLIRSGRRRHMPTLQTDPFAPPGLHAQLQPIEAVEPPDTLLVDRPAFSSQHHMHAQVTEPRSIHGDLPNAQAQGALITCLARRVPNRSPEHGEFTRPLHAHMEALLHPGCQLAPLGSLQSFFLTTSCRICLSSVRSATIRFSRVFSSSSILSRRSSVTPRSAYFFFQV
jgi:hypothetical protein